MVISSLVVETLPEATKHIAEKLACIKGVEVHEINGYKIVVTIEADSLDESHDVASTFIALEGTTGVSLIYVNFEEDPVVQKATAK